MPTALFSCGLESSGWIKIKSVPGNIPRKKKRRLLQRTKNVYDLKKCDKQCYCDINIANIWYDVQMTRIHLERHDFNITLIIGFIYDSQLRIIGKRSHDQDIDRFYDAYLEQILNGFYSSSTESSKQFELFKTSFLKRARKISMIIALLMSLIFQK